MSHRLRDVHPTDLDAVHALNEAAAPAVNSLARAELDAFAASAEYFRVAEDAAGDVVAFLIGLLPGHPYESPNYRWFSRRYPRFAYVDRIVVGPEARGRGLGAALYADFARFAAPHAPVLTCEVNLRPRNEPSLRFHERLGFRPVGTQRTEGGKKEVVLLEKRLDRDGSADPAEPDGGTPPGGPVLHPIARAPYHPERASSSGEQPVRR